MKSTVIVQIDYEKLILGKVTHDLLQVQVLKPQATAKHSSSIRGVVISESVCLK